MNTILATVTSGPEMPVFTGVVLLVTGALLVLLVVMIVAGFNAARKAATTYVESDA